MGLKWLGQAILQARGGRGGTGGGKGKGKDKGSDKVYANSEEDVEDKEDTTHHRVQVNPTDFMFVVLEMMSDVSQDAMQTPKPYVHHIAGLEHQYQDKKQCVQENYDTDSSPGPEGHPCRLCRQKGCWSSCHI